MVKYILGIIATIGIAVGAVGIISCILFTAFSQNTGFGFIMVLVVGLVIGFISSALDY